MGRFCGKVGYVTYGENPLEPGVWENQVTEKVYFGDVQSNYRRYDSTDKVNMDLVMNMQVSVLADPYAYQNFPYAKYVELNGVKWSITSVELNRPRMILHLGGQYIHDQN